MTEKRFKVFLNRLGNWIIEDIVEDRCLLNLPNFFGFDDKETAIYFANELNVLYEENEQLKKDCTILICHNQDYRKENEQLKYQNELLSDELEQCKAVINKKWSEYLQKKELQE